MRDHEALRRVQRLRAQSESATGRADLTEEAYRLAHDFYAFVREAWSTVDPRNFISNWHLGAMAERLQALADGEVPNLLICVPPSMAKSLVGSVLFQAWLWTRNPIERLLCSSHTRSISVRDTVRSRAVMRSPWYRARWPHIRLKDDQDTKLRFVNTAGGSRVATSTGSAATGERADLLVVDDANDLMAAHYPDQLQLAKDHYDTVLRSRGTGERTKTLIIAQRVAFDDLPAHVLDQMQAGGEPFDTLILPMRFSPTFQMQLPSGAVYGPDPRDERRTGGSHEGEELLFPALFPETTVKRLEVSYANRVGAILQQSPDRQLGRMFDVNDLKALYPDDKGGRYDLWLDDPGNPRAYEASTLAKLLTVDLAVSTSSSADYTVMLISAISPDGDLLLLDMIRDRLEGPDIVPTLHALYRKWRPGRTLIESVGFQLSIIQQAQREGLVVEPVKREAGQHKQARAIPLGTLLAEGRLYASVDLPHRDALEKEINEFPGGAHDDAIDALADAAREVLLGHYYVPRLDSGLDYSSIAGPFGPARPDMTTFPEPPGGVYFDPPGAF